MGFDVNVRCQEADEFIAENEGLWGKIFFFPDKMGNTERNILPGNAVVTVWSQGLLQLPGVQEGRQLVDKADTLRMEK